MTRMQPMTLNCRNRNGEGMSKETVFVRPAAGRVVRDPVTREALPEGGLEVPRNSYWLRRLRDGDVIEGKARGAGKTKRGAE